MERLLLYVSLAGFGWLTLLTVYYAALRKRRAVFSMVASFGVAAVVTVWTAVVLLALAGVSHLAYGFPEASFSTVGGVFVVAYFVSVAELTAFFLINQWTVRRLVRRYRRLADEDLTRALKRRVDVEALADEFDTGEIEVLVVDDTEANAHSMALARPSLFSPKLGKEVLVIKRPLVDVLEDDELEAVLAHEFAHIEELDARFRPYFEVLAQVYSFDPVVRVTRRYMRRLQEYGADDRAVEVTGNPAALGRALVKVAEYEEDAGRRFNVKERAKRLAGLAAEPDGQETYRRTG
jgi:Zn-dependent protease with chaperone function